MIDREQIGIRIAALRKKAGLSQQALAEKAGVYPAVFNAEESTKILEESLIRYRNMLEEMKK